MIIERYNPSQDGKAFRHSAFLAMADEFRSVILGALEVLQEIEFEFLELDKAHAEQMRPDLLYRHALPFCITERSFFELSESSRLVLAALLAGHTLALTHLDYHLDGSDPDPDASATARRMPSATATAYSLRMVYAAGRILDRLDRPCTVFEQALDPISGFVVSRMHQDWYERYSPAQLSDAANQLDAYLTSPQSRIQGSGYWEVMIRGSFASHRSCPTMPVVETARALRRLRQVVDEIADFREDLLAGLVTSPLLFALNNRKNGGDLTAAVLSLWQGMRSSAKSDIEGRLAECWYLTAEAGGLDRAYKYADQLWRDAIAYCQTTLGPRSEGYLSLFDLKRAKLEMLVEARWMNVRTEAVFV